MLRRSLYLFALLLLLSPLIVKGQTATGKDIVLVLPFENTTSYNEYNWIGQSFADALSDLLNITGLAVLSSDEREMVYQRMRLPTTVLPSRATAIKIAREAKATLVLFGTYSAIPTQDGGQVQIQGTARLVRVGEGRYEGRFIGEGENDKKWISSVYDFGGALPLLQRMQGDIAYQILYQRDKALPYSRLQFEERATKVPQRAFESYVKGIMTNDTTKREAYLTNALKEYAREKTGQVYSQAAFELGHLFLEQKDWKRSAEYLSKVEKSDKSYAEAAFYASLAYWYTGDLVQSLGAIVPLTTELPLTITYNNAGAISIQAARQAKRPEERARLLEQGLKLLSRAAESLPDDPTVRFNYAYALFLSGKYAEATDQLRPVISGDPRDGQAHFIFAKALEKIGKPDAATAADNEARRYLQVYAKWQTEWQKGQTLTTIPIRLYQKFNRALQYNQKYGPQTKDSGNIASSGQTDDLLTKARDLYKQGRDDEALSELRAVLVAEPVSAQAYLMIGLIYQRRGDLDASISSLKTAIFWDAKLVDAHIVLGRIFLERGDRPMATTHANMAIQIAPNNQEAIALYRQVTTGSK